jgi:hypothetical protein
MSKVIYLDLFSGAAGDMLLGALLDAGLALDVLEDELGKMDLAGYELQVERQVRHGLSGTKLHVRDVTRAHPARHLDDVRRLVEGSRLSETVKEVSTAVFERLARVEGQIHGLPIEEVHFHEISAVDSLVDVVGFIAGLERLGVERVFASSVPLGSGFIDAAHGRLPVPVPATLALLTEVGAPTRPHPAETEIVTPTAAALLSELATFERPPMRVKAVGYGFGQKEFPWANGLRIWLGEAAGAATAVRDQVALLVSNIDDATGEVLGYAMERLFDEGALDVWFEPLHMKKNRPGIKLSVLCSPEDADRLAAVILRETPTLGLRWTRLERIVTERQVREVETRWGTVRVKDKWLGGERVASSPEYEDCARIAREEGISLREVIEAAREAAD